MAKQQPTTKRKSQGNNKKPATPKNKIKQKTLSVVNITPQTKCNHCVQSICCTYITHQIDTPRSMEDFDYLLWQVSHENVALFKDDDGWFLSVSGRCAHLHANGMCGIYENRPQICREHSNDCCEFDGPAEEDFELYFSNYDALNNFCRNKFKQWDQRFKKWNKKTA